MSCDVGHRRDSDLTLGWLRHRPVATAPIRPLAWKPPYATDMALKRQKNKINGPKCSHKSGAERHVGGAQLSPAGEQGLPAALGEAGPLAFIIMALTATLNP